MSLKITANLQWGEIFLGKIDFPMSCELGLARGYYLIYADLNWHESDTQGLDIFAILNSAFQLDLKRGFLMVEQAGFFTFSASDQETDQINVLDVFPDAPLPEIVKKTAKPVQNTASFWTSINIDSFSLFGTLIQVGYEGENNISLAGTFVSDMNPGEAVSTTTYTASFPRIVLLGIFDFQDLTLEYRFDEAAEYKIDGTLCLRLFGNEYCFEGRVVSTEETLKACIESADPEAEITDPFFGLMRGVTFKGLIFGVSYKYAEGKQQGSGLYRVQGTVEYADFTLTGQLYLKDSDVILASVAVEQGLDIGKVFNQSIPGPFEWPSKFINIVFHEGTRLYYSDPGAGHQTLTELTFVCACEDESNEMTPSETEGDDISYVGGFNIYSLFTITVMFEIDLAGTITITNDGVNAQIQLIDPIDIFVLQITAPKVDPDPEPEQLDADSETKEGPIFNFNSVEETMGFKCGLTFFQADFGLSAEIEGRKGTDNNLALKGTLRSDNPFYPVLPVTPIALDFSYSNKDGFQVSNWPEFDFVRNAIDFAKTLTEIANAANKGCGDLLDFVDKQLLVTNYKMTPTFDTVNDDLYFVLNGSYEMFFKVPGKNEEESFLKLDFPEAVRVLLPSTLSMEDLPTAIFNALRSASESFVNALLNNGEAIATFLVFIAGKNALENALTLVCKNLVEDAVAGAVEAGMEALQLAGGLVAGGLAVIEVVLIIGNILSTSCFVEGTKVLMADGTEKDIEKIQIGDVLLGLGGIRNSVVGFDHPKLGSRKLYAINQGAYFVTAEHPFMTTKGWKSIDPKATARENGELSVEPLRIGDVLVGAGGNQVLISSIEAQSAAADTQLFNFKLDGNNTYHANGYVVHNKGGGGGGESKNPSKPKKVELKYVAPNVHASWEATSNAQKYSYEFVTPDGRKTNDKVKFTTTSANFPIDDQDPMGAYKFEVKSVKGNFSSGAAKKSILRLQTPQLQIALVAQSTRDFDPILKAQWTAIDDAVSYELTLNGAAENQAATLPCERLVTFSQLDPVGPYSFAMAAMSDGSAINSVVSESVQWNRLPHVTGLKAKTTERTVLVEWDNSNGAIAFVVSVDCPDFDEPEFYEVRDTHTLTINLADDIFNETGMDIDELTIVVRTLASTEQKFAPVNQQIPSTWTDPVIVDVSLTPAEIATQCFAAGASGIECAEEIKAKYPEIPSEEMCIAMKDGGYPLNETELGLEAVYPHETEEALVYALSCAYSLPNSRTTDTAFDVVKITDEKSFQGKVKLPDSVQWPKYRVFLFADSLTVNNLVHYWDFNVDDIDFTCSADAVPDLNIEQGNYVIAIGPVWQDEEAQVIAAVAYIENSAVQNYDRIKTTALEGSQNTIRLWYHLPEGVLQFNNASYKKKRGPVKTSVYLRAASFSESYSTSNIRHKALTKSQGNMEIQHDFEPGKIYNVGIALYSVYRFVEGTEFKIDS